jgi:F420 biosynthesis protein FbiB-like protein
MMVLPFKEGDMISEHPAPRATTFDEIVRGRRSVRALRPDPVPHDLIKDVLDAARWAPSPHGRMPWRFAVLTQQAAKQRLADAMAHEWQRQLNLDGQSPDVIAIRLQKSQARMLTAPVLIIPCLYLGDLDVYGDADRQAAEHTMAIQSLGAAIQNMLLKAYELGLDAGWMCAPLFCPELVAQTLELDPALIPHALIPLGYAAADPKRRARLPLDELVVHWQ